MLLHSIIWSLANSCTWVICVYDAEDGFQVAVISVHGLQDAVVWDLEQKKMSDECTGCKFAYFLALYHLKFGLCDGEFL